MSISSTGATPPQGPTSSQVTPSRANGTWEQPDRVQAEGKSAWSVVTEAFDKIVRALPEPISSREEYKHVVLFPPYGRRI